MPIIETEAQLEDALSAPNAADIEFMSRLEGDIVILGASGKMGPSLAARIKRATDAVGVGRRVIAVSRFSAPQSRAGLESAGVETISCDLLDRGQIADLPDCENVFFLAGRKFGSTERADLTWAINSYAPGMVADRYCSSRVVVFSTSNVYPFVNAAAGGSVEADAPQPRGEYASSCLGRERIFEYFSHTRGARCLIFRLNYSVDLTVPAFNVIWQGDANSYALRSLELCAAPPRVLNVTGPETIATRRAAEFFAERFKREAVFQGSETAAALLNNAGLCHALLGYPEVTLHELMEMAARWVEVGGASLNKPTKFEALDGRY